MPDAAASATTPELPVPIHLRAPSWLSPLSVGHGVPSARVGGTASEALTLTSCLWDLPDSPVMGSPFTVTVQLEKSVSVKSDDFIVLYNVGRADSDLGSRWYLVTADRLEDGFHWDVRGWGDTLSWARHSASAADRSVEMEFRYFRREWQKSGPLFVSPSFLATFAGGSVLQPLLPASPSRERLQLGGSDGLNPLSRSHSLALLSLPSTPRRLALASVDAGCTSLLGLERAEDPRVVGISARRLTKITTWMEGAASSPRMCWTPYCSVLQPCHARIAPAPQACRMTH